MILSLVFNVNKIIYLKNELFLILKTGGNINLVIFSIEMIKGVLTTSIWIWTRFDFIFSF
jgi:hypothetical protein